MKGKRIEVSEWLVDLLSFLIGIEAEITTLLNIQKKLLGIKDITKELLDISCNLIKEYPRDIIPGIQVKKSKNLNNEMFFLETPLLRSKMILILCYMDVLFSIITAYEYQISNTENIISQSKQNFNHYVQEFLLNKKNSFYQKNKERLRKINPKNLKDLRNRLIHFFSVNNSFWLSEINLEERTRLENSIWSETNLQYLITNGDELFSLLKEWTKLLLKKFSKDYNSNPLEFNERIIFVKDIVKAQAPKMLIREQL